MEKYNLNTPASQREYIKSRRDTLIQNLSVQISEEDTYLGGAIGQRRQKAILKYLDQVQEEFGNLPLGNPRRCFIEHELFPVLNYNHYDYLFDLRLAASIWILDRLQASGKMPLAYQILPDEDVLEEWNLPPDFYHPSYSDELIQSVVSMFDTRYPSGSYQDPCNVTTQENATGRKLEPQFNQLLSLLPEKDVAKACRTFNAKVWELVTLFMKGTAIYQGEIDKLDEAISSLPDLAYDFILNHIDDDWSDSVPKNIASMKVRQKDGKDIPVIDIVEQWRELEDTQRNFMTDFIDFFSMDKKEIRRKCMSREVTELICSFTVDDPYELCFALFYLLDHDVDIPWLFPSGCTLMDRCQRMLPWYYDEKQMSEQEQDSYTQDFEFNLNGWLQKGPVADPLDYLHTTHKGQNLAQIVYRYSHSVVPLGRHPFEENRRKLVEEGMDEETARLLTNTMELLYLPRFHLKPWWRNTWEEEDYEDDDDYEESPWSFPWQGDSQQDAGQKAPSEFDFNKLAEATSLEKENLKLKEEARTLKKQLKSLKGLLSDLKRESESEKTKFEHEIDVLRMEHRELSDLRELLFHFELSQEEQEKWERVEAQYEYPYRTRKQTVVFGGHESFLKVLKPLLPDVRFVEAGNYSFQPDLVKNAQVVWIQSNRMSHAQFNKVASLARKYKIQMRYFGYASAEKCAEQLVTEDLKD